MYRCEFSNEMESLATWVESIDTLHRVANNLQDYMVKYNGELTDLNHDTLDNNIMYIHETAIILEQMFLERCQCPIAGRKKQKGLCKHLQGSFGLCTNPRKGKVAVT